MPLKYAEKSRDILIRYNEKADVWSMGVLLYELLAGYYPFNANSQPALIIKILSKDYEPLPHSVDKDTCKLVKNMLNKNPAKRLSLDKLLKSSVLAKRCAALKLVDLLPKVERTRMSAGCEHLSNGLTEGEQYETDIKKPSMFSKNFDSKQMTVENPIVKPDNDSKNGFTVIDVAENLGDAAVAEELKKECISYSGEALFTKYYEQYKEMVDKEEVDFKGLASEIKKEMGKNYKRFFVSFIDLVNEEKNT